MRPKLQYLMKHIYARDMISYLRTIANALKLIRESGDKDYVFAVLEYVVTSGEIKKDKDLLNFVRSELPSIKEGKIMTLAQQWMQQGVQQDVIMGSQEGLKEGW